jgi:hypothetical protein
LPFSAGEATPPPRSGVRQMAAILPIVLFIVVVLALNFFEFGRGD